MRSVRLSADQASQLKGQLSDAAAAGWPEEVSLWVSTDGDSFGIRAADVAAVVFRPDVPSPRFDRFRRWWLDLESGCRLNGIASDDHWASFDKSARECGKSSDRLLALIAGSHEVYVVADQLSSWRAVADDYGVGYDFEEEDGHGGHGQNYRGGDRSNFRGGDRRGGNRYAGANGGGGYGRSYGGGGPRQGSWGR